MKLAVTKTVILLSLYLFISQYSFAQVHAGQKGLILNRELISNEEAHENFNENDTELRSILVESHSYDLDSDGKLDQLELFKFHGYENEPGDYHRIKVTLSNGAQLDEHILGIRKSSSSSKPNEIRSDLITLIKHQNSIFAIVYGYPFASEPPELTIFDFSTGSPRRIFSQNLKVQELLKNDQVLLTGFKDYRGVRSSESPKLYGLTINENKLSLQLIIQNDQK